MNPGLDRRKLLWTAWFLAPLCVFAFHIAFGERLRAHDLAAAHLAEARAIAASAGKEVNREVWARAAEAYALALKALPEDAAEDRRLVLRELAHANLEAGETLAGIDQLQTLVRSYEDAGDLASVGSLDARAKLAAWEYYAAWLLRREGAGEGRWRPRAVRARQHYRFLAENAEAHAGPADSLTVLFQKNLEAVVRLERIDTAGLLAIPLPRPPRPGRPGDGPPGNQPGPPSVDGRRQIGDQIQESSATRGNGA